MKGGVRLGWALKVEEIHVSWRQRRVPWMTLQALRGVGRVCLVLSVLVASHLAEALAVVVHAASVTAAWSCADQAVVAAVDGSLEIRVVCVLWASVQMRNALSCHVIVVGEHALHNFIVLKYIESCFMA